MNPYTITGRSTLRDYLILSHFSQHRYLTSQHIQQFCFLNHASEASAERSCRRVLARLVTRGYLSRVVNHQVGGFYGGSTAPIYTLTRHRNNPSVLFLDHSLAIADIHASLTYARFRGTLQLLDIQTEPETWREFTLNGGFKDVLKPDLFAITTSPHENAPRDLWFLEVDRNTESLAVILRKCRRYIAYRHSLEGQCQFDIFPRVVWLVPTKDRERQISRVLDSFSPQEKVLFRVIRQERFTRELKVRYYLEGRVLGVRNRLGTINNVIP